MQRVMKMATSQAPLNKVYAEEMRNHPYGYALYQPTSSSIIKPGVVGFFDKTGFWSPLADLNDEEGLKAAGLSPPSSKLVAAPDQLSTWGVMTSKSTSGQNFEANPSIGPAATGLPLNASIQIKYTTSASFGAVLVTAPPIVHSAFYYQSPFSHWVTDNAKALLSGEHKDDIRKYGLVVVTQTYSTSKCALTSWSEGKGSAYLGFNAEVAGVGKIDPNGGWYEGNSAGGWVGFEGIGDDKMVVFVGGLWYDCEKEGIGSFFRAEAASAPKDDMTDVEATGVVDSSGDNWNLHCKLLGLPLPSKSLG